MGIGSQGCFAFAAVQFAMLAGWNGFTIPTTRQFDFEICGVGDAGTRQGDAWCGDAEHWNHRV